MINDLSHCSLNAQTALRPAVGAAAINQWALLPSHARQFEH